MDEITIRIEIDKDQYAFGIPVEEWDDCTTYEKIELLGEFENEARERYCEYRTSVNITRPDGTEEIV